MSSDDNEDFKEIVIVNKIDIENLEKSFDRFRDTVNVRLQSFENYQRFEMLMVFLSLATLIYQVFT